MRSLSQTQIYFLDKDMQQYQLLEQLGSYKYLCVSQFMMLGRVHSKKTLYKTLQQLMELGRIDRQQYKFHPSRGRDEDLYYLTPKGSKVVMRKLNLDTIKAPSSKKLFYEDYIHRKRCIDIQIMLYISFNENNIDIQEYWQYFDTKVNPKTKYHHTATKIAYDTGHLFADAIFLLRPKGGGKVFALELHQGHRVKKICDQVKRYSYILAQGCLANDVGVTSNPRILIVCEHEQTKKKVMEHLSSDTYYIHMKPYFLFVTYDQLMVTPLAGRQDLSYAEMSLTSFF